jgi:hypothetical protein
MSIVDELVTILGLKTDPSASKEASNFSGLLSSVGTAAVAVGAALAAAAGAVAAYAVKQADAIDKEAEFAETLGVSYQRFQELSYAAKLSGGDVQSLMSDMERLQETMYNPVTGEYNKSLSALGINARKANGELKGSDTIIEELAGKFEGLTKAQQNNYAKLLRISPATLRLLQQGKGGIAKLTAEAHDLGAVLDNDAVKAAQEFGDSMDRMRAAAGGAGRAIAAGLVPGLGSIADGVTAWVKANRKLLESGVRQFVEGVGRGFKIVGDAIGVVIDYVSDLLPDLGEMTEGLDATQAIAIAVAAALTAAGIAALVAAAPFIAMAAGIAALVVVVEDLYAAFTGGESIIGDWVKSFTTAYPEIAGVIGGIIDLASKLAEIVGVVLVHSFEVLWDSIKTVFGGVFDLINKAVGGIDATIGAVRGLAGATDKQTGSAVGSVPVPASITAGAGASSTQNTQIVINGAGDPAAVGQEVVRRGGLGASLQQSRPGALGPTVG